MNPNIKNILIYGRVDEDKFIEVDNYRLPIGRGGLQKNLILNIIALKKKFNVYLALCGIKNKEQYKADGINILFVGKHNVNLGLKFYFSFLKELLRVSPFRIEGLNKKETAVIVYNEFLLCLLTKIFHPQFTVIFVIETNYPQLFWRPRGNIFLRIISLLILIATIPITDKIIKIRKHPWRFEKLIPFLKKKSYFLPNSVNRTIFKPSEEQAVLTSKLKAGFKKDDKILLYVGRLKDIEYKNPEMLFKSFEIIEQKINNIKLLLVGTAKGDLDSLLKKYSIKDKGNIFHVDPVINEQTANYYQLSSLTILTSNSEGCPYTVLESLACGTPCVVTDVLENGLIKNGINGYIAKSRNPQDFANTVIQGLELSCTVKSRDLLDPIYNIENREGNLLRVLE